MKKTITSIIQKLTQLNDEFITYFAEAVEHISNFIDDTYAKSSFNRYENLKIRIDHRNNDEDLIRYSLLCNSKSFQMVNDEYRQGIKSDFGITETDDAYTVKLGSSEYTVSKDVNECSCLCFSILV